MPRRVKLPDGQVLNFPDDVTDQEISAFLNEQSTPSVGSEGDSLRGLTATGSLMGSHAPINESTRPLDAGFLDTYVNPALQSAAHPTSLTDMVNLLIPGQVPAGALQSAAGAMRGGAKTLGNLAVKGAAMVGDVISPDLVGVVSPRLGKGLELAQRLRGKLPSDVPPVPAAPKPRAGSFEDFLLASPERRAEISAARADYLGRRTPTASAPVSPAAPSAAPPAAATPAPSRSAPAPSIRLTSEESQALQALVAEGHDPADVVQAIVQNRQAAQPSMAPSGKPSLNAAETKEYQRLLGRGKSPQEAMSLIEQQRAFQQQKGLPTSEQTRRAVVDRNTSGRWD